MTNAEDEETGEAQTSTDEETTGAQADADEEAAGSSSADDEESADSQAPPREVEDRGAGETSGMEDIRMVAAAMRESEQIRLSTSVHGDEGDDLLPSAVGGFGSIAGAALIRGPAQRELVPPPATQEPSSKAKPVLFGAIVVLIVAVGALSWLLVKNSEEQKRASDMAAAQLSVGAQAGPGPAAVDLGKERESEDDLEPGKEKGEASEPEPGSDQGGGTDRGTDNAATEDGAHGRRPASSRPRPKEHTPEATDEPAEEDGAPKPAEQPEEPPAKKAEDLDADCILNPDRPECQDASTKKTKKAEEDDAGAGLPDKLTQNDVRDGFGAVKGEAKACGATYGVAPGTKVRVKVSISGGTGLVISATALGEHADAPVGKCVAEALSKAKFGQFKKSVMGVTYPVTL